MSKAILTAAKPGALAGSGLKHVELAVVDGELHVLHVVVVLLQYPPDLLELLVDLGHGFLERGQVGARDEGLHLVDGVRRADAGNHVLALRIHQIFAVEVVLAGGGVTGEPHTSAGVVTSVAEDHGHDNHRSAPVVGEAVEAAVGAGLVAVPAVEHALDGTEQLVTRLLGELLTCLLVVDVLELLAQLLQGVGRQSDVELNTLSLSAGLECVLIGGRVDARHDVAVHGDEPAVRVVGRPLVGQLLGQAQHRLVVQTHVQHCLHHPGHRHPCAGSDGDE